jgi:hypothetical protein
MALILAIESDRRQVNHLTAMVRGRLHAELVLADTAERALEKLGDRLPDLILTSALLSPKDEQALSDRLRSLDGVASHVQTLTLPVFAPPKGSAGSKGGGVLSALLGDRKEGVSPDGCDPAVFADQCKEYLDRAAAERQARAPDEPAAIEEPSAPVAAEPPTAVPPEPPRAPAVTRRRSVDVTDDPSSILAAVAMFEDEMPVEEPARAVEPPARAAADDDDDDESNDSRTDFVDLDLSDLLEDQPERIDASADDADDSDAEVYELSDVNITADADVASLAATVSAHTSSNAPDRAPAAEEPFDDWQEVVDALKREGERTRLPRAPRTERPAPEPPRATAVAAPQPAPGDTKRPATGEARKRRARARQLQDEWGVFDPDQAGMPALFAKLAKRGSDDESETPSRPV